MNTLKVREKLNTTSTSKMREKSDGKTPYVAKPLTEAFLRGFREEETVPQHASVMHGPGESNENVQELHLVIANSLQDHGMILLRLKYESGDSRGRLIFMCVPSTQPTTFASKHSPVLEIEIVRHDALDVERYPSTLATRLQYTFCCRCALFSFIFGI